MSSGETFISEVFLISLWELHAQIVASCGKWDFKGPYSNIDHDILYLVFKLLIHRICTDVKQEKNAIFAFKFSGILKSFKEIRTREGYFEEMQKWVQENNILKTENNPPKSLNIFTKNQIVKLDNLVFVVGDNARSPHLGETM